MSDELAKNLRHYRKKAGLTQADLANITSVSLMSIRRYEATGPGNREPSASTLNELAKALGVHTSVLLSETQETFDTQHYRKLVDLFAGKEGIAYDANKERLNAYYCLLNSKGQDKALEQVEMLTKIPEYTKDKNNPDQSGNN